MLFAICSAAFYVVGYVLEKQALGGLPQITARPLGTIRTVAGSRRWLAGFAFMVGGLGLQVGALTLAPVSVVQPILAAGLIGLAALGGPLLDERLGRRHLAALGLVVVAVLAIAVSARTGAGVASRAPGGRFAVMAVPVGLAGATAAWLGLRRRGATPVALLLISIAAGLWYGLGALAEKGVATVIVAHGVEAGSVRALGTIYPWLFAVATVCGMIVFQIGLQRNPATLMASFSNLASGLCALLGAAAVFGEQLLPGGWWTVARLMGFVAVVAAVGVMALERAPVSEAAVAR